MGIGHIVGIGTVMNTGMNRVVDIDTVVIVRNRETESVGDNITAHETNIVPDHDTNIKMNLVETGTNDPDTATDARHLADETGAMTSAMQSPSTHRMTTQNTVRRAVQGQRAHCMMDIGSKTNPCLEMGIVQGVAAVAIKLPGKI
jgi:hypothetical protein